MTAPPIARRASAARGEARPTQPFVTQFRGTVQTLDVLVVASAVLITSAAGFGQAAAFEHDPARQFLALTVVVVWPVMLWQKQSTATTTLGAGLEEYRRVIVASTWTLVIAASAAYVTDTERGRWFLGVAWAIGTLMLVTERHVMRLVLHHLMAGGRPLHRVFVLAAPGRDEVLSVGLGGKDNRFEIVGAWHLVGGGDDPDPRVIVSRATALSADTIVYSPLGTEDTHWTRQLGWAMEESEMSLLVSPSLVEIAGPRLKVEPVQGLAFVRVDMPRFSGPARVVKRGLDIVCSALALVVLGLPMLVIAGLIRRDSPGPAIYRQPRAGVRSETFECLKFRTMFAGADAERAALRAAQVAASAGEAQVAGSAGEAEPAVAAEASSTTDPATFKMADDPRVTRTGRWLRKFSIDELPQLVNVLKGEMSLVGPRPHPLDDVERYDDVATRRLLAKPGMTGLWQVSGRSDLDWEHAVRLDLYYVENWSLAGDLLILLRTVKVVVSGNGAY